ncbi:MAG: pyridoxamine 5'-phosphate oxidase [Bacteroidetes bacterium]|nr:pyridoxamine 5'-phosphate oxidase [Bacteroidota bacterium]
MDKLKEHIYKLRKDFALQALTESSVHQNPINQFEKWFNEAMQAQIPEVNAFDLATVSAEGIPSLRIVLLRDFSSDGFSFFTNYNSQKGKDIEANPNVCLNFFWPQMERQIRIQGIVEKLKPEDSDLYFSSRPRGSQIGALASAQSEVVNGREPLEQLVEKITKELEGQEEVKRPEHWGGYMVKPAFIEFWQGRPSRLHDRIRYKKNEKGDWVFERLSP